MSNKKYNDSIRKEKLWGKISEELKNDAIFKSIAATVKTFSPYHQNICKSRIFAIVSEVDMTDILQETKSTHSSEYSSGSPDETGI